MFCGDTALLVMVIVFDVVPPVGGGVGVVDELLPHETAKATAAAAATPAARIFRLRMRVSLPDRFLRF
jgi:hypothetical protein